MITLDNLSTPSKANRFKVDQLKQALKEHKLPTDGKKAILIARLTEHLRSKEEELQSIEEEAGGSLADEDGSEEKVADEKGAEDSVNLKAEGEEVEKDEAPPQEDSFESEDLNQVEPTAPEEEVKEAPPEETAAEALPVVDGTQEAKPEQTSSEAVEEEAVPEETQPEQVPLPSAQKEPEQTTSEAVEEEAVPEETQPEQVPLPSTQKENEQKTPAHDADKESPPEETKDEQPMDEESPPEETKDQQPIESKDCGENEPKTAAHGADEESPPEETKDEQPMDEESPPEETKGGQPIQSKESGENEQKTASHSADEESPPEETKDEQQMDEESPPEETKDDSKTAAIHAMRERIAALKAAKNKEAMEGTKQNNEEGKRDGEGEDKKGKEEADAVADEDENKAEKEKQKEGEEQSQEEKGTKKDSDKDSDEKKKEKSKDRDRDRKSRKRSRSRSRDRKRDRDRHRDRGRDRKRGSRDRKDKDRDRDRGDRDKERKRSRDRKRSDRDRDRDRKSSRHSSSRRDRDKDRDRDRKRRRRSHSRDRKSSSTKERKRSSSRHRSSKKKKSGNWDKPPELGDLAAAAAQNPALALCLPCPAARPDAPAAVPGLPVAAAAAVPSATGLPNPLALMGATLPLPGVGAAAAPLPPNTQVVRQARRLYVGNIPVGLSEVTLLELFNQAMIQAGKTSATGLPPVNTAQINHDKMFAFIEFQSPEDATNGMLFDGIMCAGNALKVRRPKDYQPLPGVPSEPEKTDHVSGIVSTNVPDTEHKIFLGGLPQNLTEAQVRELVSAFGSLKAFNLVKDSGATLSKGYCFFEYLDVNNTERAIEGLNGLQIGERAIVCQRANANPKNQQASLQQLMSLPGGIMGALGAALGQPLPGNPPGVAPLVPVQPAPLPVPAAPVAVPPSRILRLDNMITLEELNSDEDYDDIMEDVRDECGSYGSVISVKIPRPAPDAPPETQAGVGQIFVEFEEISGAGKALDALGGRQFAGRTVEASFYDEHKYLSGDLS